MTTSALRGALLAAGERRLLLDSKGGARSGAELVARVDRLAAALRQACGPRPRIGLWYRNGLAAIEAFLAVQWLGGARVPVDPGAAASEAAAIFRAAGVQGVLVDLEHRATFDGDCLVHDDERPLAAGSAEAAVDGEGDAPFMVYPRSVLGGELFGVTLSYRNWDAIVGTNIALYRSGRYGHWDEASEVFLSGQQIMHGTGFLGTFAFLAMGLPQVVLASFDANSALDVIQRHRVTGTMLVPAMLDALVDALPSRPGAAGSLRHVLYGGGAVSEDRIRRAVDRLGPVLTQVYGRVEGGWPLAILDVDDHAALMKARPQLAGSCGRPIPGVQCRLRPLPGGAGETGELVIRSAMASDAYLDDEGWCSLGDVMRRDADGYLYFERRLDRMINTGYHVYPDEVEAALGRCHGVEAVLVRGEPHPRWGEMVVAYLVGNETLEPQALIARVRHELERGLARYKVPREFRIVRELPPS